jgi:hypothetical protein
MSKHEIVDYLMKPLVSFVGCRSYLQYPAARESVVHKFSAPPLGNSGAALDPIWHEALILFLHQNLKKKALILLLCFANDVSGLWTNRAGSLQLVSASRAASFSSQRPGRVPDSEARPVAR